MLLLSASGVHYSMLNTGGNTGWFARKQQGAKTTLRTVSRTRANLVKRVYNMLKKAKNKGL